MLHFAADFWIRHESEAQDGHTLADAEGRNLNIVRPLSAESSAGMESLVRLTRADMERVAATLRLCTRSDVTTVRQAASQLVESGGKRLRPMLTLAAASLSGYRGNDHVALAAAVELIHTAT